MKLRDMLKEGHRLFSHQGSKYFAYLYTKRKYWPVGEFVVVCTDHPMPDETIDFSSECEIKPIIRAD